MALNPLTQTYIGKGKAGLEDVSVLSASGGLTFLNDIRYVGGTSKLSLQIETEEVSTPNMETTAGGYLWSITRIKNMKGSITFQELNSENLALALRAYLDTEASGSVSAEAHTARSGCLVPFDHLADTTATVTPVIAVSDARANTTAYLEGACILASAVVYQCTTAGTSGSSAPTYNTALGATTTDGTVTWTSRGAVTMVDGVDYQLGSACIEILSGASRFDYGLPITVAYTKNAAYLIQILTQSQKVYRIFLDGLNEGDGTPCPSMLYRVKFTPTTGLDLKGDAMAELTLDFTVYPDTSKVGTNISQYGTFRKPLPIAA